MMNTGPNPVSYLPLIIKMSKKAKLAQKVKEANQKFTKEQSIQIANFLMSLSEVYYENSDKSNSKNKAA